MFVITPSSKERKGKGYIWATATVNKIFSTSKLAHIHPLYRMKGRCGFVFSGSSFSGHEDVIIVLIVYFWSRLPQTNRPFQFQGFYISFHFECRFLEETMETCSDATFRGIWTGSALVANVSKHRAISLNWLVTTVNVL